MAILQRELHDGLLALESGVADGNGVAFGRKGDGHLRRSIVDVGGNILQRTTLVFIVGTQERERELVSVLEVVRRDLPGQRGAGPGALRIKGAQLGFSLVHCNRIVLGPGGSYGMRILIQIERPGSRFSLLGIDGEGVGFDLRCGLHRSVIDGSNLPFAGKHGQEGERCDKSK